MRVRIFKPTKSALQSRCPCGGKWVVEPLSQSARTPAPPFGWVSGHDALSSMQGRLTFSTPGEALTFVRARGWDFDLVAPQERVVEPKSYLDRFR